MRFVPGYSTNVLRSFSFNTLWWMCNNSCFDCWW